METTSVIWSCARKEQEEGLLDPDGILFRQKTNIFHLHYFKLNVRKKEKKQTTPPINEQRWKRE